MKVKAWKDKKEELFQKFIAELLRAFPNKIYSKAKKYSLSLTNELECKLNKTESVKKNFLKKNYFFKFSN